MRKYNMQIKAYFCITIAAHRRILFRVGCFFLFGVLIFPEGESLLTGNGDEVGGRGLVLRKLQAMRHMALTKIPFDSVFMGRGVWVIRL